MGPQAAKSIYDVEQIARLPRHLTRYIVEQNYDDYSPIDHAVWRTIMRLTLALVANSMMCSSLVEWIPQE